MSENVNYDSFLGYRFRLRWSKMAVGQMPPPLVLLQSWVRKLLGIGDDPHALVSKYYGHLLCPTVTRSNP